MFHSKPAIFGDPHGSADLGGSGRRTGPGFAGLRTGSPVHEPWEAGNWNQGNLLVLNVGHEGMMHDIINDNPIPPFPSNQQGKMGGKFPSFNDGKIIMDVCCQHLL